MVLRTLGPLTNHFSTIFKTLLEPFVQCDGSPYSLKCYKLFFHTSVMNHDVIIERQCWKNIAKGGHKLNNGIVSLTLIFLIIYYTCTGRGVRRHKKPPEGLLCLQVENTNR